MKKKRYVIVGTIMLLIGMVGVNAATSVPSNGVLYSNSNSSVTTVEGALNELYTNYNNLLSKGDASAANILTGKKVLVKGKEVTGTMANNGSVSKALAAGGSYTIPKGYHDGTGKVTANSLVSQTSATATAAQILSGKTAYVNGSKITGTMTNKAGTTVKASAVSSDDNNTYLTIPTAGYYDQNSKVYSESSNIGNKVIKLGGAGTYNLSTYSGYKDFKINQNIFIVSSGASVESETYHNGSGNYNGNQYDRASYTAPSASYNASNGVLTVSAGSIKVSSSGVFYNNNGTQNSASCTVFLVL